MTALDICFPEYCHWIKSFPTRYDVSQKDSSITKTQKLPEADEFGSKQEILYRTWAQIGSYDIDAYRRKNQRENEPEFARLAQINLEWCTCQA